MIGFLSEFSFCSLECPIERIQAFVRFDFHTRWSCPFEFLGLDCALQNRPRCAIFRGIADSRVNTYYAKLVSTFREPRYNRVCFTIFA